MYNKAACLYIFIPNAVIIKIFELLFNLYSITKINKIYKTMCPWQKIYKKTKYWHNLNVCG